MEDEFGPVEDEFGPAATTPPAAAPAQAPPPEAPSRLRPEHWAQAGMDFASGNPGKALMDLAAPYVEPRAALNVATAGFNDEISGAANAGLQAAGLVPEIPRAPARGDMVNASTSGYEAGRDTERAADKAAFAANPAGYLGTQLGTAAVTGATKLPAMMAQGAAQGLGDSEAEDAAGMTQDALFSAAAVPVLHGVARGVGWAGEKIGQTAPGRWALGNLRRVLSAGIDPNSAKAMGAHTVDQQAAAMRRHGVGSGLIPPNKAEIQGQASEAVNRIDVERGKIAEELQDVQVWPGEVGTKLRHQVKSEGPPVGRRAETYAWPEGPKTPATPHGTPPTVPASAPAGTVAARGPRRARPDMADTAPDIARGPTELAPPPPPGPQMPERKIRVRNPQYEPKRKALLREANYFDSLDHQPFSVMNKLRKDYGAAAQFGTDTPRAAVRQDVHGAINDTLERAAGEQGPKWRQLGQDEAMMIRARDAAERANISGEKKGIGLLDVVPGGGLLKGRGPAAHAQATELSARGAEALGRAGEAISKAAPRIGGAVGRSLARIEAAETADKRAQVNFEEALTNPAYGRVLREEGKQR